MKLSRSMIKLLLILIFATLHFAVLGQAQTNIDNLRQLALNDATNVEAWVNLGNAYLEAGNYDLAAESFYEATSIDYLSGEAHFGLGLAEFERGDYPSALFEFSEFARLYPDRFEAHYNQAVTLAKLLQSDEAIAAFQKAITEAAPETPDARLVEAYLGLAGQFKAVDRYAEAAQAYSNALDLDAQNREIILQRADALYRAGQGREALADLSALETMGSDYRVSSLIADIYIQQDQTDYALRSLERALARLSGDDSRARANLLVRLGNLQRDLEREAEASASFQQAVSVDPNVWQAHYNLALIALEAEQLPTAISYFEQARALNPDVTQIYILLASSYEQTGQFQQAVTAAQEALQRLDEEAAERTELLALQGRASFSLGDYATATALFEEVLEVDPSDANTFLWAGFAALSTESYEDAVSFLERAVQLDNESVEAKANLGVAYFKTERFQDAAFVYQLILEENENDAEALYNLGLSMYAQEQYNEARDIWGQSSALGYSPAEQALQQYF